MVGREVAADGGSRRVAPGRRRPRRRRTCTSTDDRGDEAVRGVDLEVRAGEILGIAGVAGNGQDELVEAIIGLRQADGRHGSRSTGRDVTGRRRAR